MESDVLMIRKGSNMEENKKIGRKIVAQGGVLAIAGIIARCIGLIRRIPLTNIIGDIGNGYYGAAYEFYAIVLLLSSYSLPLAVSKLVAARVAKGQYKNARKILYGALLFALCSGGLACFIVLIFANFFSSNIMAEPMSAMAMRVLAPTLLIVAVMGVFRGYFQGLGNMKPTAFSQIIEQIFLVAFSLLGASILFQIGEKYGNIMMNPNYAPSLGAAGATIGCGVGALAGLAFLYFVYRINKPLMQKKCMSDYSKKEESYLTIIKVIILTVLPVILSTVLYNISNVLDQSIYNHYMMDLGLPDEKSYCWGVYSGKYKLLTNLPIAIANAMCSAIVPSLTLSVSQNDLLNARSKMSTAIRVTMFITIPSAIGLAVLGKPIVDLLFTGEIDMAAKMLYIGTLSIVFYSLSTLGNGILQGIGKLRVPVINSIISLVLHLGLLVFMLNVLKLGIFSVVLANLFFSVIMCVLNFLAIYHFIGYKQEFKTTFVIPIFASLIMGAICAGIYYLFRLFLPEAVACLIAIGIGVIVYMVAMILLKGFSENDWNTIPGGNKILYFLKRIGIY